MSVFLKASILAGALSFFCAGEVLAKQYCKCPVLSTPLLTELYASGQTYDNFRGYIVYTKRKVTAETRKSIASITPQDAIINTNKACVCKYIVRDSNGSEIDELGLERVE